MLIYAKSKREIRDRFIVIKNLSLSFMINTQRKVFSLFDKDFATQKADVDAYFLAFFSKGGKICIDIRSETL
jgi:hypothetical protein